MIGPIRVEVPYELPEGGEVFISADVHLSMRREHVIEDYCVRDMFGHEVDLEDADRIFGDLVDDFVAQALAWADAS